MDARRSDRSWSLARRLTGTFLATTSLFILAITLMSAWFLESTIQEELEGLAVEEMDELRGEFAPSDGSREAFESITMTLASHHPRHRLAWRVWEPDGVLWGDFGDRALLEKVPVGNVQALSSRQCWRTTELAGRRVELILDGEEQFRRLDRFLLYSALLLAASWLIALLVARLLFLRVSKLLASVAERVRRVRQPEPRVDLAVRDAPMEIRDVVDALDEMLENIRWATRQARVFTAGLAHELRSPVQNLIGETEVTLMADRDVERYRAALRSNLEELRSLADAVDNLVAICSVSEERRPSAREDFDLGEEAEIRLQRERAAAGRNGVRLDLTIRGNARVHGDREGLMRAVRNLTANAIQWSPPGSSVAVEIQGGTDEVVVTVDDAGPGVPAEIAEKIFEPFVRGPAAKGQRIGYGLGLALARSATVDQGGRIETSTSPLGGARFRMRLPR